jgi:hypothetical protein
VRTTLGGAGGVLSAPQAVKKPAQNRERIAEVVFMVVCWN